MSPHVLKRITYSKRLCLDVLHLKWTASTAGMVTSLPREYNIPTSAFTSLNQLTLPRDSAFPPDTLTHMLHSYYKCMAPQSPVAQSRSPSWLASHLHAHLHVLAWLHPQQGFDYEAFHVMSASLLRRRVCTINLIYIRRSVPLFLSSVHSWANLVLVVCVCSVWWNAKAQLWQPCLGWISAPHFKHITRAPASSWHHQRAAGFLWWCGHLGHLGVHKPKKKMGTSVKA